MHVTVARRSADHLLSQEPDGDVELLAIAQFPVGAGGREFLADQVHIRVRALAQQLGAAGITQRRERAQAFGRRLRIDEERREPHRERALAHAHRTRHDPRVVRPARTECLREPTLRDLLAEQAIIDRHARERRQHAVAAGWWRLRCRLGAASGCSLAWPRRLAHLGTSTSVGGCARSLLGSLLSYGSIKGSPFTKCLGKRRSTASTSAE